MTEQSLLGCLMVLLGALIMGMVVSALLLGMYAAWGGTV